MFSLANADGRAYLLQRSEGGEGADSPVFADGRDPVLDFNSRKQDSILLLARDLGLDRMFARELLDSFATQTSPATLEATVSQRVTNLEDHLKIV